MNLEKVSIGKMAKQNGLSEQTLRLYDKIGLFSPMYRNEKNGYRYYDIKQNARLDMIQYLKSIGLSLTEIKERLDGNNESIEQLLAMHMKELVLQQEKIEQQKKSIFRLMQNMNLYKEAPPEGVVFFERMSERYIYAKDLEVNFYGKELDVYEMLLREFKQHVINELESLLYFSNIGTTMDSDLLTSEKYFSSKFFVFLNDKEKDITGATLIPAGNYLTIYCSSYYREVEYMKMLKDYTNNNDLEFCGDYICEVLLDLTATNSDDRGMFMRLQVPVKARNKQNHQ